MIAAALGACAVLLTSSFAPEKGTQDRPHAHALRRVGDDDLRARLSANPAVDISAARRRRRPQPAELPDAPPLPPIRPVLAPLPPPVVTVMMGEAQDLWQRLAPLTLLLRPAADALRPVPVRTLRIRGDAATPPPLASLLLAMLAAAGGAGYVLSQWPRRGIRRRPGNSENFCLRTRALWN